VTKTAVSEFTCAILATLLLALGLPAQAAPVTVTAPSTVNFNFDLTGSTPSPPFGSIEIFPGWGDLSAGDAFSAGFFPELNSQGPSTGSCLGVNSSCAFSDPLFTDGLFSMSVEALFGQFTVDPGAIGLTSNFRLVFVSGSPPLPTALSGGQTIIFNFDLTGILPGPPFGSVKIYPGWGDLSAGDAFSAGFFPELNGQGPSTGSCLGVNGSCEFSDPSFTDGLFSMSVEALFGEFTVQPGAIGLGANFQLANSPVFGSVQTEVSVPEPDTLVLLGVALAGLALSRRRKLH